MVPIILFALNVIFITFQSRFVFGGDSSEYSTIARTWGIAHPPGYPLYSLLINIVNGIIPFGTTPWRIALLSSIPTVITAYCIYKILCFIKIHRSLAFATSLLYLFLFPIWQYALIPEVFALHTMFASLITYLLLRFSKNNKKNLLLVASFLCGLSISHHHIFILFIPGWLYLLKGKLSKIYANKKLLLNMFLLICLGASFYLYAIIVSLNNTILDWENAKTLSGFFQLITRSSYGSFKAYSSSGANIVNQISDMISGLVFIFLDFKILGIAFITIGLYACKKYVKNFSNFLYISLTIHFAFLFYTNFVLTNAFSEGMFERFLIPLYLVLIFFLGIGIDYVYKTYFLLVIRKIRNSSLKKFAKANYTVFISFFIVLIAVQNFKTISLISQTKTFERFGKDIIDTIPYGGIFSVQGDNITFPTYYHLYGLGERKDLTLFQPGLMEKSNYIQMIKKRSPSLTISGPIKSGEDFQLFIKQNVNKGYYSDMELGFGAWRPYGLFWKYYPDDLSAASDSANLLAINKTLWENKYKIPLLSAYDKNIFHLNTVSEYYLNKYQNYASLLIIMNKYTEADAVLKNIATIYKKGDLQSEAVYMNILVKENKCKEALVIAKKINIGETIKLYPGFVKSVIPYLETCDPKNELIPKYKQQLLELEKSPKTDLNSF